MRAGLLALFTTYTPADRNQSEDLADAVVGFVAEWLRFYDDHPAVSLEPYTIADAWRDEMGGDPS